LRRPDTLDETLPCIMSKNHKSHYMVNMQKLLYMAKELHDRGFHDIRVVPSLSPSGLSWRCTFLLNAKSKKIEIIASSWIQKVMDIYKPGRITVKGMADMFIREHAALMEECSEPESQYVAWYAGMLQQLEEGELPYAYSDSFSPSDYWRTSKEKSIRTLAGENRYYGY